MRTKFSGILTLLMAFIVQITFAQEMTISGTVTDQSGLPLPGVNIVIKGTNTGTQTDFDGNYSIKANRGSVLSFSYLGFATQEQVVDNQDVVNIQLREDASQLEEVVVTALGILRKSNEITTSVQTVREQELNQANNPNAVISLAGKVSGLQINTTNSSVNPSTRIILRGNRSLTGDNQALIVIDGVISTAQVLTALDPNIIESVNVLKGANGAALYGSRGANGVLIVTTKQGNKEDEKFKINVNSAVSFTDIAFIPERQTRYGQGWNGDHISYENGAWGPEFDGTLQPVGLPQEDGTYRYFEYSPIKDNIKEFFQTGTTLQNTVSFSGGNADGYVYLSANDLNTEFIINNDKLKRNTFNFKGGKRLGKWNVSGNVTYITQKTEEANGSIYNDLLQTATNIPVEEFSEPNLQTHWTSYYRSPYWIRDNERTTDRADIFTGIGQVSYDFNDNINVTYTANLRSRQRSGLSFVNGFVDNLNIGGGDFTTISSFDTYTDTQRNIYADLIFNFDYQIGENFTLKANVGNNFTDNKFVQTTVGGDNLTIPGFYNIDNIPGTPRTSNTSISSRGYAFFANADFGFKDYLFLNVTARNDWTSVLDKSLNSFFYPSAGISFIPTNAIPGLKGNILNQAKLTASIVKVGNAAVNAYDINQVFNQTTGFPFGSLNSFGPDVTISDPLLENEFLISKEFNINLGFFKDRLTIDGSYYSSSNQNQIVQVSASNASGVTNSFINIGETETNGFEIDLGITPIRTEDFRWDARIFYQTNETKVIKVSDDATEVAIQAFPNNANPVGVFAIEGEEFPVIKGSAYERDPQGRVLIDPVTGNPRVTSDLKKLGKSNPDYIVGLNTSIEYKGFRLAGVFDYRTGHQFWSGAKSWLSWSGHLIESAVNGRGGFIYPNSAVETAPGVYEANNSVITGGTTYSNFLNYFSNNYYSVAENFVLDATAFKVRELSLSYTFPKTLLNKTSISNLTLGVNAINPFIILPKENRGYGDPETSNVNNNNGQGLAAIGQYPTTRSYGFNINITF